MKISKIFLVFILLLFITGCNKENIPPVVNNVDSKNELVSLGYSEEEITSLKEIFNDSDFDLLTQYDKVDNIIEIVNDKEFKIANLKKYLDSYIQTNNFKHSIIIVNYDIKYQYNEKLVKLFEHKFFIPSRLDRYMNYDSENIDKLIVDVNCNLDYDYYTNIKDVDIDKLIFVNKYYRLSKDYKNSNMIKISNSYSSNNSSYLDKEAYEAFKKMVDDAKKEKLYFVNLSSYRSYSRQETIYNNYVKSKGDIWANKWSAKAGHSEHQTGLAVDVCQKGKNSFDDFEKTDEYSWLKDNSYKYGFILRYPKGKEELTGYNFEAWHYRYVGIDIATYIYENDITLEEYYAYFIEK